jgi:hypothetical protein
MEDNDQIGITPFVGFELCIRNDAFLDMIPAEVNIRDCVVISNW